MLTRIRTRAWGRQSKPPASGGAEGGDKHVHCPGVDGLFDTMSVGEEDVSYFETMHAGCR